MEAKIHTVKNRDGSSITFTLKSNAVNIFEEPNNNLWTFDLAGRLVGMFIDGNNYRRTLDNKYYLKTREVINSETFRNVEIIDDSKIIPLIDEAYRLIDENIIDLPEYLLTPLRRIREFDFEALQDDATKFRDIYLPISILPPDQYMSLVVQLTEGCNYNQCTFCNFYKDRPFKIKSNEELDTHIKNINEYFGDGINLRKSIFLADANAVATPQSRLLNSLKIIQSSFPQQKEIFSFIDVFTGLKKTVDDFKELKRHGLKRVYLGIESGSDELMSFLNKDQLNADIIELSNILHSSGIGIGAIFLVGAGGDYFASKHQNDSINLLEKLNLIKGDIVYLSELYETNNDYIDSMQNADYALPSRPQIRQWSNEFKKRAKETVPKQVQVSVYDINQFFY